MDKYEDMAYMNERGVLWLKTLREPTMWSKWLDIVRRSDRGAKIEGRLEDYAYRIVLEAIWHRGYAKDADNNAVMARCARRLRKPPDRGAGATKGGSDLYALDLNSQALPREFILLDEFLEHTVKPAL